VNSTAAITTVTCKITKQEIRDLLDRNPQSHTPECRAHNPRGKKSHFNGCPDGLFPERLTTFGGYHCICDWMERLRGVPRITGS
jgi:hypothetical protein